MMITKRSTLYHKLAVLIKEKKYNGFVNPSLMYIVRHVHFME